MCNIKDQIVTLLKQRHHSHKVALEQEKDPRSKHAVDLIARIREDSQLIELIDSLPEEEQPEGLEEAAEKRKMGITPIGIMRMKVQELKWADVDEAGDLDIHPLEKDKYDYAIKQCDKIIAFIDNLPLTIAKESPVLNEAADDYQTTFNKTIGHFYHDDQKRAFIAGAEWQREQMMKIITKDDNLEEAGTQYVETYFRDIDWTPDVIKSCLEEAFISGGEYVFKQIKYE